MQMSNSSITKWHNIHSFESKVKPTLIVLLCLLLILIGACTKPLFVADLPLYLPTQYYNCMEATPAELVGSYFSGYTNASYAEAQYNNQYFVFKNLPVKDWMIADLDKGYIWLGSGVKCELVNPADMKKFKLDQKIDVVGLNTGVISYKSPGLLFTNCYVMPAGSIQLPIGTGGGFSPGY